MTGKKLLRVLVLCFAFSAILSSTALASKKNSTDVEYPAPGGVIYFDRETGTITGTDSNGIDFPNAAERNAMVLREAVIPREIDGVTVTAIGNGAFAGCRHLTRVVIPDTVTSIGDRAFFHCLLLNTITIPNGVTEIGKMTFYGCESLTSVILPDALTRLGDQAFARSALKSVIIPKNVTHFGKETFYRCTDLSAVILSEGITEFGKAYMHLEMSDLSNYEAEADKGCRIFQHCDHLTSVVLPSTLTCIGDSVFENCSRLTKIEIPEGVKSIGRFAFYRSGLIEVTFPKSLEEVGDSAFSECRSLTHVTISADVTFYATPFLYSSVYSAYFADGMTEIPSGIFMHCRNLFSVRIPKSVTRIGSYAFSHCSLNNIIIPDSVVEIEIGAFSDCMYLSSVTLSRSVTRIGIGAFSVLRNLPCDIYYEGTQEQFRAIEGLDKSGLTYNAEYPKRTFTLHDNCDMPDTEQLSGMRTPFDDVPEDSYFALPVAWASCTGITGGTTPATFSPYDTCNMAQVLTLMWRACYMPEEEENPFQNRQLTGYYATAVKWACAWDILFPEEFDPNAPCTRAMLMKLLWRFNYSQKFRIIDSDILTFNAGMLIAPDNLFYYDAHAAETFSDVAVDSSYANAVGWALDEGITQGTTDTTFSPEATCTRAQVMAILFRANGKNLLSRYFP